MLIYIYLASKVALKVIHRPLETGQECRGELEELIRAKVKVQWEPKHEDVKDNESLNSTPGL